MTFKSLIPGLVKRKMFSNPDLMRQWGGFIHVRPYYDSDYHLVTGLALVIGPTQEPFNPTIEDLTRKDW